MINPRAVSILLLMTAAAVFAGLGSNGYVGLAVWFGLLAIAG